MGVPDQRGHLCARENRHTALAADPADVSCVMSAPYLANVTLHVLAAMLWLGGMFFLALVGAPVLRRVEPPALRQQLFRALGERFRTAGWLAIAVLVTTGFGNLYFRGWLQSDGVLASAAFWHTTQGHSLALKLGAVVAMLVVEATHDFVLGPMAGGAAPGSPRADMLRRRATLLARASVLLGLVIVLAAVKLARAG